VTGFSLDGYQAAALRTVNPTLDGAGQLLDAACGLAEEGGEVLALVRKHVMQGRPLDPARLTEELGDALWCIATVAHALDIPLSDVARANVEKLHARHPERFDADHEDRPSTC
jgi:NTP pyrophosphatase (non-canonical NTP hydrolase)